jgi:hypothetical protein
MEAEMVGKSPIAAHCHDPIQNCLHCSVVGSTTALTQLNQTLRKGNRKRQLIIHSTISSVPVTGGLALPK